MQQKSANKLIITTYSRLHLTLLAMHSGEYRMNGGIGFGIKQPNCHLSFSPSERFEINDQRLETLTIEEHQRLLKLLRDEQVRYSFESGLNILIKGSMLTHSGFGSGTAIALSSLEALHLLNCRTPSEAELINASGRGGTSGVGINTYFNGGCVFDLGKPINGNYHVPSNLVTEIYQPLLLSQTVMPDWDIGICIPQSLSVKTQAEEKDFFERVCPISASSAYEAIYHSLFGLFAAIKENNKSLFCKALKAVQDCAWKKAERSEYGELLVSIENALYINGASAVGMSSLGPSLFFLADDIELINSKMRAMFPDCELLTTQVVNHGRTICYD